MSILGIESVVFGTNDLDTNFDFWRDYGLRPLSDDADEKELECQNGARIVLRRPNDPTLPPHFAHQNGMREVIWGVQTQQALDKLVAGLKRDRDVTIDAHGVAHFTADGGIPMGLGVWTPKPFVSCPDAVNAPGHIRRLNQHRMWRQSCKPKCISHVLFFSADYIATFEFLRDRLDFRYTDHSRDLGIFLRADGAFEHHSIFLVNMDLPFAPPQPGFMHMAFTVDDIDELMLGVQTMKQKRWLKNSFNTKYGLCRHRISSSVYCYIDIPTGGEAEYHADTDYLDDNWIPRVWDWKFGSTLWATEAHELWKDEAPMDVQLDPRGASIEAAKALRASRRQAEQTQASSVA